MALQALAKYAAATYSPDGVATVTVTSLGGLNKEFVVDQSNRLLYQEQALSEVPGEYTIRAAGRGCVLAQVHRQKKGGAVGGVALTCVSPQISAHYNIPPPPDFSAFNVSATVMAKCNASRPQLILFVDVRYQGRRDETNMVIVNVKLLSGYALDRTSLDLVGGA